jgi:hypothetical protein
MLIEERGCALHKSSYGQSKERGTWQRDGNRFAQAERSEANCHSE